MRKLIWLIFLLLPFLAIADNLSGGSDGKNETSVKPARKKIVKSIATYKFDSRYPQGRKVRKWVNRRIAGLDITFGRYYSELGKVYRDRSRYTSSVNGLEHRSLFRLKGNSGGRTVHEEVCIYDSLNKNLLRKKITSYLWKSRGFDGDFSTRSSTETKRFSSSGKLLTTTVVEIGDDTSQSLEKYVYDARDSLIEKQIWHFKKGAYSLTSTDSVTHAGPWAIRKTYDMTKSGGMLYIDSLLSDSSCRVLVHSTFGIGSKLLSRTEYRYDSTGKVSWLKYSHTGPSARYLYPDPDVPDPHFSEPQMQFGIDTYSYNPQGDLVKVVYHNRLGNEVARTE